MEIIADFGVDYFSFARHKNVTCISHLHTSLEIVCVTKGCVKMTVNGKGRIIGAGQATIIMPLETHSFEEGSDSECMVCVFASNLVENFYEKICNSIPGKPICELEKSTLGYIDANFPEEGECDILKAQSILIPLCENLYEKCSFSHFGLRRESAFLKAVEYTASNFTEISGLSDAAEHLGVNSAYLSRIFKQNSRSDYTDYLNSLKCSYAARLLIRRYPELNISEIALASGFGSIRSFNRVFAEFFSMTPKEYVKQKKLFSL